MGKIGQTDFGGVSEGNDFMKVALVHDDLVQWGGAERVLEGLCEIFPDAPIFTSVYDYSNKELAKRFGDKKIITSFLQKIVGWKTLYKALLPLYPIAFEQFDLTGYDLVISHTTRFAKSIITKPQTKHICYCHTPPRFLWHIPKKENFGAGEVLFSKMRIFDRISSARVDHFIAGSKNAQKRIQKIYKMDSTVIYPFIDLGRFEGIETFDGGYFVVVSRLNKYKKADLAVEACKILEVPLKIIGTGPELDRLKRIQPHFAKASWGKGVWGGIELLGHLNDDAVVKVLAGCKGLIVPGIEDFGLVALEAQALGKPVIAYSEGGSLETVVEGKSGIFFHDQSVDSLVQAIKRLGKIKIEPLGCIKNASEFSKENFISNFKLTVASLGYTI
ncbi:glycosyltransferase [Candidatus Daviesbacteria bacterium]|nr:glycosyltransferase [Candidatus Daviesbacteria bacterium]